MRFTAWAPHPACPAVPAFVAVHDKRRVSFLRMRRKNIHRTNFDADVAAGAGTVIEYYWSVHITLLRVLSAERRFSEFQ